MIKISYILLFALLSNNVLAHCPSSFKPENVCLMLSENVIYIYDHKLEHNGPYKDLNKSSLSDIKSDGQSYKFSRLARGVYKIDSDKFLKKVLVELTNENKKISVNLKGE